MMSEHPLLTEARQVVEESGFVSHSLLMRKMRITHTAADGLIRLLNARGVQ